MWREQNLRCWPISLACCAPYVLRLSVKSDRRRWPRLPFFFLTQSILSMMERKPLNMLFRWRKRLGLPLPSRQSERLVWPSKTEIVSAQPFKHGTLYGYPQFRWRHDLRQRLVFGGAFLGAASWARPFQ